MRPYSQPPTDSTVIYCGTNQAYVLTGMFEEHLFALTVTVRTLRLLSTHDIEAAANSIPEATA